MCSWRAAPPPRRRHRSLAIARAPTLGRPPPLLAYGAVHPWTVIEQGDDKWRSCQDYKLGTNTRVISEPFTLCHAMCTQGVHVSSQVSCVGSLRQPLAGESFSRPVVGHCAGCRLRSNWRHASRSSALSFSTAILTATRPRCARRSPSRRRLQRSTTRAVSACLQSPIRSEIARRDMREKFL